MAAVNWLGMHRALTGPQQFRLNSIVEATSNTYLKTPINSLLAPSHWLFTLLPKPYWCMLNKQNIANIIHARVH